MTDGASATEQVTGGCMCGSVRYVLTGPIKSVGICHCNSCRKSASSPSMAWLTVGASDFRTVAGEPSAYRSSEKVTRTFCGKCGSPLTYHSDNAPSEIDVTAVSLDMPDLLPPTHEGWLEEKLGWTVVNPMLAHFPRGTSGK